MRAIIIWIVAIATSLTLLAFFYRYFPRNVAEYEDVSNAIGELSAKMPLRDWSEVNVSSVDACFSDDKRDGDLVIINGVYKLLPDGIELLCSDKTNVCIPITSFEKYPNPVNHRWAVMTGEVIEVGGRIYKDEKMFYVEHLRVKRRSI